MSQTPLLSRAASGHQERSVGFGQNREPNRAAASLPASDRLKCKRTPTAPLPPLAPLATLNVAATVCGKTRLPNPALNFPPQLGALTLQHGWWKRNANYEPRRSPLTFSLANALTAEREHLPVATPRLFSTQIIGHAYSGCSLYVLACATHTHVPKSPHLAVPVQTGPGENSHRSLMLAGFSGMEVSSWLLCFSLMASWF